MEPELFDAPISVSDSRLSLNCDCKRGIINEVTMMYEIGDSLNHRKKMEPELFDVPISVSTLRLSLNCNCRRRRINEVTIMDLSATIMVEILTKLPIKMIFRWAFWTFHHTPGVLPGKSIEGEGLFLSFPFSASILTPPPLLTMGHLHLLSPLFLFSFIVVTAPPHTSNLADRHLRTSVLFSSSLVLNFALWWSLQLLPISGTVEISVVARTTRIN
ncbi:hypothetical protein H5410_025862, partial [Solanum commersonii]